jgi:glycosyltransferase involved in cell wall biosynthesis
MFGETGTSVQMNRSRGLPDLHPFHQMVEFNPDVICLSHGGLFDITYGYDLLRQILIASQKPVVTIVQANTDLVFPSDEQRAVQRDYFTRADRLLFVSRDNLEIATRLMAVSLPRAGVIDNPVNLDDTDPVPWKPDARMKFATVGRLDSWSKGQDLLFTCLAEPEWKKRNWSLALFGTGRHEGYLRDLVSQLQLQERITFEGQVRDVKKIWAEHHMLVLPSRLEGMPLVILEAMACARPSLVTAIGGAADWIDEGVEGFIADAPTIPLLRSALERAWRSRAEWEAMGLRARDRYLRQHDKRPGKTLLGVLKEAAGVAAPASSAPQSKPGVALPQSSAETVDIFVTGPSPQTSGPWQEGSRLGRFSVKNLFAPASSWEDSTPRAPAHHRLAATQELQSAVSKAIVESTAKYFCIARSFSALELEKWLVSKSAPGPGRFGCVVTTDAAVPSVLGPRGSPEAPVKFVFRCFERDPLIDGFFFCETEVLKQLVANGAADSSAPENSLLLHALLTGKILWLAAQPRSAPLKEGSVESEYLRFAAWESAMSLMKRVEIVDLFPRGDVAPQDWFGIVLNSIVNLELAPTAMIHSAGYCRLPLDGLRDWILKNLDASSIEQLKGQLQPFVSQMQYSAFSPEAKSHLAEFIKLERQGGVSQGAIFRGDALSRLELASRAAELDASRGMTKRIRTYL